MGISSERKWELEQLCIQFRIDVIKTLHKIQTGHPGGSLSVCEILTAIYFQTGNISPENYGDPDRDKVILCKGHAAPMLYRILAEKEFFPKEDMDMLRQINSHLQGHPCCRSTRGVEVSSGPLGISYPFALGVSAADRMDGRNAYTYAILGDGELNEGVVWETCMNVNKLHADHLISIVDWNRVQLDGTTDEIMPIGNLKVKFSSFGYHVIECDGHDIAALCDAIEEAKKIKGMPTMILAHTVKGKGVSFMEGKNTWHGKAISDSDFAQAMKELGGEQ